MKTLKCSHIGCSWSRESTGNPTSDKKSIGTHLRMEHGAKLKRKYTKRAKLEQPALNSHVKFCPSCGCNIETISIALNLVK